MNATSRLHSRIYAQMSEIYVQSLAVLAIGSRFEAPPDPNNLPFFRTFSRHFWELFFILGWSSAGLLRNIDQSLDKTFGPIANTIWPLSVRSLGRKNHLASNLCGFVFLGGFRYYSGRFYRIFNNDKHIECANLFELVYWTRNDQPTFSELRYFISPFVGSR